MIKFEYIEDMLAMAQKIEIGAAERYMRYAETARSENPEIAALFQRLAEEERKHEECVIQLAEEASVDLSNTTISEQFVPSDKNGNTAEINDSLYKILAAAVKREELAFDIYSQIAVSTHNDKVRHYAEILAKEELGHASLLRAMRRRVYQEHKVQIKTKSLPGPDKLNSIEDFFNTAYILEKSLATYLQHISDSGVDMSTSIEHSEFIIHQLVDDIGRNTNSANLDINKLDQLSNKNILPHITTFTLDNLLNECESTYEYYDNFVLKTGNEEIMNEALSLAAQTLTQLILLHEIKNNMTNE